MTGTSGLNPQETASLIQTAMIMAGTGTLVQLFTIWKLGTKLPIVMGISFTFVSVFCYIGPKWGYGVIIGAVLIGGVIEGLRSINVYWDGINLDTVKKRELFCLCERGAQKGHPFVNTTPKK